MGLRRVYDCLYQGEMDYHGQQEAYYFQFYVIWACGVCGFVYGFIHNRFLYSFYILFAGFLVSALVAFPAWPYFNSHPVKWLETREEFDEEEEETDEERKERKKKAKAGKEAKKAVKEGKDGDGDTVKKRSKKKTAPADE